MTASMREQVIEAAFELVKGAVDTGVVTVMRNPAKAASIPPGGVIYLRDGDPGEPEVTFSPLAYTYTHRIPLLIGVVAADNESALDALMAAIGTAVVADRTLGGLCEYLETEAPVTGDIETAGAAPGLWAEAAMLATYITPNPLT